MDKDRWSKEFHRPAGRLGVRLAHRLRGAAGARGAGGAGGGAQSVEGRAAEACQVRRDHQSIRGEGWFMVKNGMFMVKNLGDL